MAVPGYGSTWTQHGQSNPIKYKLVPYNLHRKCKLNSGLPARKREYGICQKRKGVNTCRDEPQCPELLLRWPQCRSRQSGEGNPQGGGLPTFSAAPVWAARWRKRSHFGRECSFEIWDYNTDCQNETWRCSPVTPRPPLPVLPDSSPGNNLPSTLKTIHQTRNCSSLESDRLPLEVQSCAKPSATAQVHDQVSQGFLHLIHFIQIEFVWIVRQDETFSLSWRAALWSGADSASWSGWHSSIWQFECFWSFKDS